MKTMITLLLATLLSTNAQAEDLGKITCSANAFDFDANKAVKEVRHACDLFQDPEFGPSGDCEFEAMSGLRVNVKALGGEIDELSVELNEITAVTYSGTLMLIDQKTKTNYTVVCAVDLNDKK